MLSKTLNIHLLLLLLISSAWVSAQTTFPFERMGCYTQGGTQLGFGYAEMVGGMELDTADNVYSTGLYSGPNATFFGDTINTNSSTLRYQIFLNKLSPSGEQLWIQKIEVFPLGASDITYLSVDKSGNSLLMFRIYNSDSIHLDSLAILNPPSCGSFYIVKFDNNGNLLWYKTINNIDNTCHSYLMGLDMNEDGDFVTTILYGDSIEVNGTSYFPMFGQTKKDYLTICFDDTGGTKWTAQTFSNQTSPFSYAKSTVKFDDSNNVYTTIMLDSTIIGEDTTRKYMNNNLTDPHIGLIKYNSTGGLEWYRDIQVGRLSNDPRVLFDVDANGISFFAQGYYGITLFDSIILDSTTFSHWLMAEISPQGELKDYVLCPPNILHGLEVNDLTIYEDHVLLTGSAKFNNFSMGSVSAPVFNSTGFVIEYDTVINDFKNLQLINTFSATIFCTAAKRDSQKNLWVGGGFFYTSGLNTPLIFYKGDTLSGQGRSDAFLFRRMNCDYMLPSISSGTLDSVLCGSVGLSLNATSLSENVNFQWLFGGVPITGATDSNYAVQIPGTYSVRVSDSVCNRTSDAFVVSNGSTQSVSFTMAQTTFCSSDSAVSLYGGSPTGGYYSGPGVNSGVLNPSAAGLGTKTIYYVFTQSTGCVDSVGLTININPSPNTYFFQSFTSACTADTITLNSGSPAGGSYSGLGVVGNQFYPASAGVGLQTLYYTKTSSGCSATDSISVLVKQTPNVSFNCPVDTVCENASPFTFSGQTPMGGTFSGSGVSGNYFIPGILDPGSYTIVYTKTTNGCTGTASDIIQIDSIPNAALPPLDSVCLGAVDLVLVHGQPSGGIYTGLGISNNMLDASVSGIGIQNVNYIYENGCGADTAISTISIIANPTFAVSVTSVSCNGLSDGAIATSVNGGNTPYSILWSTAASTANISNIAAGNYTITATGELGCLAIDTFTVSEPQILSIVLDSLDDVVCNGFIDGEVYISVTGGSSPNSFLWSNGATSEDVTNLEAGVNTVIVTDNNGCQDSFSVIINEVNPIMLSTSTSDITCFDFSDGAAMVSASGGGGTYTYNWSNGSTGTLADSLNDGETYITVSDQNGCETSDTVEIFEPDSLSISVNVFELTCFESGDGMIYSNINGGRTPYSYSWSNSSSADSIFGLSANTYTLTVMDFSGCEKTASVSVSQPDSLQIILANSLSISCNGGSNGEVSSTIIGGTTTYTYSWNTGESTAMIDSLLAGSYLLTVTDANGCTKAESITIGEPAILVITLDSLSHLACFESNDGAIYTSANGGVGTINFAWNTGPSTSTIQNLSASNYFLTISDQNSCQITDSFQVTQPQEMEINGAITHVNCFGDSTGEIVSTVSNNQGAFTISWSNGSSSLTNSQLPNGIYSITITDSAGCEKSGTFNISEPNALAVSVQIDQNLCFGDSVAQILLSPSGGVLPYEYIWNNGEIGSGIDSLSSGSYEVTLTDSNGCEWDTIFIIDEIDPLILIIDSVHHLDCYGDSSGYILGSAYGGTGTITFLWNDNTTNPERTNLNADNYSLTISDINGCENDSFITITQPNQILAQIDSFHSLLCFGDSTGAIFTTSGGGTGALAINWNNGDSLNHISNLEAGNYELTVTDTIGCFISISQEITQPPALILDAIVSSAFCSNSAEGKIESNPNGGVSPYNLFWSTADSTFDLTDLLPGEYYFTLTDANKCSLVDSISVEFNFQAPNPSLGNDTSFCKGSFFTLHPDGISDAYFWSDGSNDSILAIDKGGVYSVTLSNDSSGCFASDSILIITNKLPVFSLGADKLVCHDTLDDGITIIGPVNYNSYLWNTNASTSSIVVNQFGTYFLELIDSNFCHWTDTIEIKNDTCLNVQELHKSTQIRIYPNPTLGTFTIELSEKQTAQVVIYAPDGRELLTSSFIQTHLFDLSQAAAGLYLIKMNVGKSIIYKRLIVN